jgi:beta-glucosidase
VYFPSSPLRYIKEHGGASASVTYDPGTDPVEAAKAAAAAQVAIVFVTQWMTEGQDAHTLSLPDHQDQLVSAVAAANPNTIVVLETGGPVDMPWSNNVKGIVESWYPGVGGAQALANVLFGTVNPSGKLSVTFPAKDADLPHPQVPGLTDDTVNNGMNGGSAKLEPPRAFTVDYNVEGMMVGYRWFQAKNKRPLFPFGFGLSYTRYAYSGLKVDPSAKNLTFMVQNTGTRDGEEIAEVYVTLPDAAGEPFRKLAGWKRVAVAAGASQTVTVPLDPLYLSIFDTQENAWRRPAGEFRFEVGGSSNDLPLHQTLRLPAK